MPLSIPFKFACIAIVTTFALTANAVAQSQPEPSAPISQDEKKGGAVTKPAAPPALPVPVQKVDKIEVKTSQDNYDARREDTAKGRSVLSSMPCLNSL